MWCIVYLDHVDGLTVVGPFDNYREAEDYAMEDRLTGWQVHKLLDPQAMEEDIRWLRAKASDQR